MRPSLLTQHFENLNFRCNNYKYIFYNMMQMKKLIVAGLFLMLLAGNAFAQEKIEKWGIFELTLNGPSTGNPFMGVELLGRFTNGVDNRYKFVEKNNASIKLPAKQYLALRIYKVADGAKVKDDGRHELE